MYWTVHTSVQTAMSNSCYLSKVIHVTCMYKFIVENSQTTTSAFQGSVATVIRWGGLDYNHLCRVSSWCCTPKIIKIGQCSTEICKI